MRAARSAGERGATAVEFALVAPILFLFLFGGLEAGRILFVSAAFRSAIADSARCAELGRPQCRTAEGLARHAEARMAALAAPLSIPPGAIRLEEAPCGRAIRAGLAYRPLLLPLPAGTIRLAAEACAGLPA